jgi:putative restriction endonuclease
VGDDAQLRLDAFQRIRELEARYGDSIPWSSINEGFSYMGEQVRLSGRARGIFRPRQMVRGVLSIKTTIPRGRRMRRYDDIASDDGFFEYRFMGDDPRNADNQALRETMEDSVPLIYFHAVAPSVYRAIWPAFITIWDPMRRSVHVVPGEVSRGKLVLPESADTRRYVAVEAKRRLHQAVFRELVLDAYQGRCAVSGLPERRLLHAAHILPDRDERGLPVISNGIAMSTLHHSAYDANLLGIDAAGRIHVNRDLLEIHDGPTLEYALKGLHGKLIRLPSGREEQPSRDFLAARFEQFTKAK